VEHRCNQCGVTTEALPSKCHDCGCEILIAPWEDWHYWKDIEPIVVTAPGGETVTLPRRASVCEDCYHKVAVA
jgi:hypothetical protein